MTNEEAIKMNDTERKRIKTICEIAEIREIDDLSDGFHTSTCEYCRTDSEGYVKPIEKNSHAFIRFGVNGWVLSLKGGGWHGECKIRYCPMCGRDLLVK